MHCAKMMDGLVKKRKVMFCQYTYVSHDTLHIAAFTLLIHYKLINMLAIGMYYGHHTHTILGRGEADHFLA